MEIGDTFKVLEYKAEELDLCALLCVPLSLCTRDLLMTSLNTTTYRNNFSNYHDSKISPSTTVGI